MANSSRVSQFDDSQGLEFLELFAHNLTIAVRIAASHRQPEGPATDDETHLAMYWINEALHNVVQLTRELRLDPGVWSEKSTWRWLDLWCGYKHGAAEIEWAVEHTLQEMST